MHFTKGASSFFFFKPKMNLCQHYMVIQSSQLTYGYISSTIHFMGFNKGVMISIHHCDTIQCIFTAQEIHPFIPCPADIDKVLLVCSFQGKHPVGILEYVAFSY